MNEQVLDRKMIWLMSAACAIAVANVYYNQPLLERMGATFGASAQHTGLVATATQVGYAAGMLLFVPLADLVSPRRLVVALMIAVAAMSSLAGLAPTLGLLVIASFAVGMTACAAQTLIPFAASVAPPKERGQIIGHLMGGVLLGILLARTVAGFVAAAWGWRAMFFFASGLALLTAAVLWATLPRARPKHAETTLSMRSYLRLMQSLWTLARTQPRLRESALIGACVFGSFSAFWATLAYKLAAPPFEMGSRVAGLFGAIGAVGVAAAPLAGRLADRRGPRFGLGWAIVITLVSFALLYLTGNHLWGLIAGVILLDAGVQGAQVSNQSRIFSLMPTAQGRMNTVYMITYFIGGALGSYLASLAWSKWNWPGVCATGEVMTLVGLIVHAVGSVQGSTGRPAMAGAEAS